jgi:hypothetical protein
MWRPSDLQSADVAGFNVGSNAALTLSFIDERDESRMAIAEPVAQVLAERRPFSFDACLV